MGCGASSGGASKAEAYAPEQKAPAEKKPPAEEEKKPPAEEEKKPPAEAPASPGATMADEAEASRAKKAAAAAGVQTEEKSTDENGHAAIAAKIESSAAGWQELCKAVTLPAEGMAWPLAFVADQDEASAQDDGKSWKTHLAYGKLVYLGGKGSASYSVQLVGEAPLLTDRGDKSQRGAEYSALEVFAGKLVTFDDRTGNCDELE